MLSKLFTRQVLWTNDHQLALNVYKIWYTKLYSSTACSAEKNIGSMCCAQTTPQA